MDDSLEQIIKKILEIKPEISEYDTYYDRGYFRCFYCACTSPEKIRLQHESYCAYKSLKNYMENLNA